jgi:hypothetical protein
MRDRVELQTKLETFLGSRNVYFQPPESFKLRYPCIIYQLSRMRKVHADNRLYQDRIAYQVTIIDEDPDSEYPKEILKWEYCSFDRFFKADNLNHWVFELYF